MTNMFHVVKLCSATIQYKFDADVEEILAHRKSKMSLLWIIKSCMGDIMEATEACWFVLHNLACSSNVLQYYQHLVHAQTQQTLQHLRCSSYRHWTVKSTFLESVISFYLWPKLPNSKDRHVLANMAQIGTWGFHEVVFFQDSEWFVLGTM